MKSLFTAVLLGVAAAINVSSFGNIGSPATLINSPEIYTTLSGYYNLDVSY